MNDPHRFRGKTVRHVPDSTRRVGDAPQHLFDRIDGYRYRSRPGKKVSVPNPAQLARIQGQQVLAEGTVPGVVIRQHKDPDGGPVGPPRQLHAEQQARGIQTERLDIDRRIGNQRLVRECRQRGTLQRHRYGDGAQARFGVGE